MNEQAQLMHDARFADAASAYLCIPPQLLLHASFVADSDGGSLLLRLLSPPLGAASSSLLLRKSASRASLVAALCAKQQAAAPSDQSDAARDAAHLLEQLEGPCANLRLITIEARVAASASGGAASWAAQLSALAYAHVAPFRRLKVLLNPIGGPGKARVLFAQRIRPILEAAGCVLDVEVTRRAFHGTEIARAVDIDAFDGIVCVSGDGMLHEVLNGLASRADARAALRKLFVAPIPTGSGNGVAVNILGAQEGFNLALACLNVIKGRAMEIDVCSVTQPRVEMPKRKGKPGPNGVAVTQEAQEMKPYTHVYSFLSQAIGLMADIDLGTEHMRALGDARFV
jgi:sphingosine kinase